jgi:hypothetical protein
MIEIQFATVNQKIAKSGFAVNQYIQNAGPGEPYAEPKIDVTTKNIILDPLYLESKPITHAQITLYGNSAVNSIQFYGRRIEMIKDGSTIKGYKIFASSLVTPFIYQAAQYDELSVNSVEDANYYAIIDAIPTVNEYAES